MLESAICKQFYNEYRHLKLLGQCTSEEIILTHIGHGVPLICPKCKYKNFPALKSLQAMGLQKGIADYMIMWNNNIGFIEFKTKKGKIQKEQLEFANYCDINNINHSFCRSAKDGIDILKKWGILK